MIRTTAACWRRNRLPSAAEQKKTRKRGKTQPTPFQRRLVHFFSPVVVRKWTNGYQCSEGKSPISPPGFPSWYYFLRTRQEMKFSLCAVSPRVHCSPLHLLYLFYQDILYWGREDGASSPSPNREVVPSNNMPYTSALVHGNRAVSIYRIIWWRTCFWPFFFSTGGLYHIMSFTLLCVHVCDSELENRIRQSAFKLVSIKAALHLSEKKKKSVMHRDSFSFWTPCIWM